MGSVFVIVKDITPGRDTAPGVVVSGRSDSGTGLAEQALYW
jgi:hypothetical protein